MYSNSKFNLAGYKSLAERAELQERRRESTKRAIERGIIPTFGECLLYDCSPEIESIWRNYQLRKK